MDTVYDTAANEKVSITVHRKETPALRVDSEKILAVVKNEWALSLRQMAIRLGITQRAVERQMAKLRKYGKRKRFGPAKGGHWDAIET
jgi:predicted HTH transcriptional regulator